MVRPRAPHLWHPMVAASVVMATTAYAASELADIPPEFSKAPAIFLEDRAHWIWPSTSASRLEATQRVLIQDSRGFDLADQEIVYDASEGEVKDFKARTVLPDGRVIPVPQELIQATTLFKNEDLDLRALRFTFPAVEEGAILEWHYTERQAGRIPRMTWVVQREIPVLESRLEVSVKLMSQYVHIHAVSRVADSEFCVIEHGTEKGKHLRLVCRNVPGDEDEPFAPPPADRRLLYDVYWGLGISDTVAQTWWEEKAQFVYGHIDRMLGSKKRMRRVAEELIDPDAAETAKIDAVLRFIREEIEPDTDSIDSDWPSRDAEEVLSRRIATASERAILALALLRALDLTAVPVLANDRSQRRFVYEMDPLSQANHLMLRVLLEGSGLYLDPSCSYCPPGIPDWRFCATEPNALIILPDRTAFVSIGEVAAQYNSEIRTETIRVGSDGRSNAEGRVLFGAQHDVERRLHWLSLPDAARKADFLSRFSRHFESADVRFSDLRDVLEPLEVSYTFADVMLPTTSDGRILVRPTDAISRDMGVPIREERTHPIWLPYRYARQSETTFLLPPGYDAFSLPEPRTVTGPGMQFRCSWARGDAPDELIWNGLLTMRRTLIQPYEYGAAKAFSIAVRHVLRGGAVVGPVGQARGEVDASY